MNKLSFIVESGDNNYSCYSKEIPGVAITGKDLSELKMRAKEAVLFHIEDWDEEDGKLPESVKGDFEISFTFDTQNFLKHYSHIFTRAALSRITGINEKQLGHYIQGLHRPRKDKAKKIERSLHKIGKELLSVELV